MAADRLYSPPCWKLKMVRPMVFVSALASMDDRVSSVRDDTKIRKALARTLRDNRGTRTRRHIMNQLQPEERTASSNSSLTASRAVVLPLICRIR